MDIKIIVFTLEVYTKSLFLNGSSNEQPGRYNALNSLGWNIKRGSFKKKMLVKEVLKVTA